MDRTPIVAATTSSTRRLIPMLLVDCPLCDTASTFDLDDDALDCPRCEVRLEVARDDSWALADAA
jgi:uncharacterized paraquat-inducible protein A